MKPEWTFGDIDARHTTMRLRVGMRVKFCQSLPGELMVRQFDVGRLNQVILTDGHRDHNHPPHHIKYVLRGKLMWQVCGISGYTHKIILHGYLVSLEQEWWDRETDQDLPI